MTNRVPVKGTALTAEGPAQWQNFIEIAF